jgi:hypothetical protein
MAVEHADDRDATEIRVRRQHEEVGQRELVLRLFIQPVDRCGHKPVLENNPLPGDARQLAEQGMVPAQVAVVGRVTEHGVETLVPDVSRHVGGVALDVGTGLVKVEAHVAD